MSREVIPVVLKYAPRQNLIDSESFELLFSLLGKTRHFSKQRCVFHAYCILLCLGWDAASSEQLHHPQHFVSDFLWLGFLCSWPLLGGSLTAVIFIRGRYCLQQFVLPVSCCYLWWHQSWDLFCLFSLHCFFQGFAEISLNSDCPALANFVFLIMASRYQCCTWSPSALHAPNLQDK